jgi:translocation and assembly module TamB
VPGLTVVDVQGSFGGGDLRIGSLRALESGVQVDVTNLHVTGLDLRWHPHPGEWIGASFTAWDADAVHIVPLQSRTPTHGPATAPTSLRSPVALDVASLRVASLVIADSAPLRDVQAALAIGADGGKLHRVDHLRFAWERVQAEASVIAQTDAPLGLDVTLAAHDAPQVAVPTASAASAAPLPHWAASATLRGPLAGFDVVAQLRGEARAGRAAPQASASAHVTPFAALPVSAVLLKTTELDLGVAAFPATLRAQFAARALVVGQHEAQGRDRDELAVPGRLEVSRQRRERQAAGRSRDCRVNCASPPASPRRWTPTCATSHLPRGRPAACRSRR